MRSTLVLAIGLLLVGQSACFRNRAGTTSHRVRGTCDGVCEHYLTCKAARDEVSDESISEHSMRVCELECAEVFSGRESLIAFESLQCDAAISFVEGNSGRGPGTLISDLPQQPGNAPPPPQ